MFVTEKFLKDTTQITDQVDGRDLSPFTAVVGTTYIQPILGYTFYNYLLAQSNAGNLNTEEEALVDYIKYCMAFYIAYEAAPFVTFRISNKGIVSQSGEFANSESVNTVEYIRRQQLKFAKRYEDRLRSFLHENKDDYPQYLDDSNDDIVRPDKQTKPKSNITAI